MPGYVSPSATNDDLANSVANPLLPHTTGTWDEWTFGDVVARLEFERELEAMEQPERLS